MHVFNLILVLDEINSGELDINGKNISSVSTGCPEKVEFCFQIQILERISGSKPIVYSRLKVYIFNQFCLDRLSIKYKLVIISYGTLNDRDLNSLHFSSFSCFWCSMLK